jgi:peptide deformylase
MAKILSIVLHPAPSLREVSKPVSLADLANKEMKKLIEDMKTTMMTLDGAGLAAPQVGKNIRLIVINDEQNKKIITLVNPVITKKSWGRKVDQEGCLSVLDAKGNSIYGPVSRHKKVNCVYSNEFGQKKKIEGDLLISRIIQHEVDHLDGILFIDKLEK